MRSLWSYEHPDPVDHERSPRRGSTLVYSDAGTLKANQQRRYSQAERDLRRHERQKTLEIILLLLLVLALTGFGLFLFHLMR